MFLATVSGMFSFSAPFLTSMAISLGGCNHKMGSAERMAVGALRRFTQPLRKPGDREGEPVRQGHPWLPTQQFASPGNIGAAALRIVDRKRAVNQVGRTACHVQDQLG